MCTMHSFFTPGTRLPTRVNFVWPKSRNDWPMSNHLTRDTPWTNYHNSENSFVLKQKAVSARITIMQFFLLSLEAIMVESVIHGLV